MVSEEAEFDFDLRQHVHRLAAVAPGQEGPLQHRGDGLGVESGVEAADDPSGADAPALQDDDFEDDDALDLPRQGVVVYSGVTWRRSWGGSTPLPIR